MKIKFIQSTKFGVVWLIRPYDDREGSINAPPIWLSLKLLNMIKLSPSKNEMFRDALPITRLLSSSFPYILNHNDRWTRKRSNLQSVLNLAFFFAESMLALPICSFFWKQMKVVWKGKRQHVQSFFVLYLKNSEPLVNEEQT